MANLPNDIIVDILIKLPVKSLLRFKCICKQWLSLISDPGFVKLHLNKEDHQRRLLFDAINTLYSIDYESLVFNKGLVAVKVDLPKPMNNIKRFDIVGCCDGLLCLVVNKKRIVICNPSTREFRKLPCPPAGRYLSPCIYGFGYDSSIDDYKVVMGFRRRMDILAMKTNTWRKIQNFDYHVDSAQGEFVNGAIHWTARSYTDVFKIVGLDLVEEKLFEVPQPDHNNTNSIRHLAVLGGCLCLARFVDNSKYYEIWLMKEYGVGDSWTKLISFPNPASILVPHCFINSREILIWSDDMKLFMCHLDEMSFKEVEICNGPRFWLYSWSYKESVVSPYNNLISSNESLLSPNEGNVIEISHIFEGRREARNYGKKRYRYMKKLDTMHLD